MNLTTESRNPYSQNIDQLPAQEILRIINREDASVAKAVEHTLPQIAQAVEVIVAKLRLGGRLIYVGAGTSGRLGMLDAVECVPTFGTSPNLVRALIAGGNKALIEAIEGAEDKPNAGRSDLLSLDVDVQDVVVGIAASGRTPYVIGALEFANEVGATTIAIACNMPAPILELASIKIGVLVGPEVITGSTRLKAGTAQKMVLNMLSTASMIKLGKVYGNLMVDVQITNQKLAQRAQRIVAEIVGVSVEDAAKLLLASNNETKTAIVSGLLDITPGMARQKLAQHRHILREVIE